MVTPVALFGEDSDGNVQPITKTDAVSNALPVILHAHREIHAGSTFQVSYKTPDASPIADNASLDILVIAGAKSLHIESVASLSGIAEIEIFEFTTVSDNGTALVVQNKNRMSNKANTATAYHTPTVTLTGTRMQNFYLPTLLGTMLPERDEWILAPNRNYLFRLTNRNGNAQNGAWLLEWYEESV